MFVYCPVSLGTNVPEPPFYEQREEIFEEIFEEIVAGPHNFKGGLRPGLKVEVRAGFRMRGGGVV